jgi:hypothetical protein
MTTETKYSRATRAAIAKYGIGDCVKAFRENERDGQGPHYCGGYRGVRVGDAMINAGREVVTGSREPGARVTDEQFAAAGSPTAPAVPAAPAAPVPGSVAFDCPGYQILVADPNKKWVADEQFAIPFQSRNHGVLYHFYQLGSVVSYAMRYKQCPIAGLERAKANGHDLHFAFALATIISDPPQAKRTVTGLAFGDVIEFEGRKFKLAPANNDNVRLVEVVS